MNKKVKYSVIVPVYNQKKLYDHTIKKLKVLSDLKISFELILVNDGSKYFLNEKEIKSFDKSYKNKVKIIRLPKNKGKGEAINEGFKKADGNYIVWIDSDSDISPKILEKFIKLAETSKYDFIYADKFKNSSKTKRPFTRILFSYITRLLVKNIFVLKINDTQTGAKLITRELFEYLLQHKKLNLKGFAFEIENAILISRYPNVKITDVPVLVTEHDSSSIKIIDLLLFIKDLFLLFVIYKIKYK